MPTNETCNASWWTRNVMIALAMGCLQTALRYFFFPTKQFLHQSYLLHLYFCYTLPPLTTNFWLTPKTADLIFLPITSKSSIPRVGPKGESPQENKNEKTKSCNRLEIQESSTVHPFGHPSLHNFPFAK